MVAENFPQLLSSPLEECASEGTQLHLLRRTQRCRVKGQNSEDRGIDFRSGPESPRSQVEDALDLCDRTYADAERSIRAPPRGRENAIRDFLLHHEERACRARSIQEMKEDRRGQIVGDVPDDLEGGRIVGDFIELQVEDTPMEYGHLGVALESFPELGGELAVQLDQDQAPTRLLHLRGETLCEGTPPGTNF
jgi:hypothetical protein